MRVSYRKKTSEWLKKSLFLLGKKLECFAKPKYKIIESKSLDILYFSVEKFKSSFEQTRLYFENNQKKNFYTLKNKFDIYDVYRKTDNLLQTNLKKIIEETKIIKAIKPKSLKRSIFLCNFNLNIL